MTRIISGVAGSLRLKGPAKATRPTSDRVKEGMFSKLESMGALDGARVLDLFAGTGALGLEAASRGATAVTFVENNPDAIEVLKSNLKTVRIALQNHFLEPDLIVVQQSCDSYTSKAILCETLVFMDPPYSHPIGETCRLVSQLQQRLPSGALIVLERASKSIDIEQFVGLGLIWRRVYGDTRVEILG